MSVAALSWARTVRTTRPLTPTQRLLLMLLADHAGSEGTCWPRHGTLAADMEVSVETVRVNLGVLRDLGLVTWERHVTPGRATLRENVYTLHLVPPRIMGAQPPDLGAAPPPTGGLAPTPTGGLREPSLEPSEEPHPPTPQPAAPPAGGQVARRRGDEVERVMSDYLDWRHGQVARQVMVRLRTQVADALGSGVPDAVVRQGLADWTAHGEHPSSLGAFIDSRARGRVPGQRPPRQSKVAQGLAVSAMLRAQEGQVVSGALWSPATVADATPAAALPTWALNLGAMP